MTIGGAKANGSESSVSDSTSDRFDTDGRAHGSFGESQEARLCFSGSRCHDLPIG
jgi:hypothetical protein